jgi:hypothetical protein
MKIKELRVLGSFTYADEFAEVIALLADGSLQVGDLTSEKRHPSVRSSTTASGRAR